MMSIRSQLAEILRKVESREEVFKATGIDAATLARIVSGERMPSGDAVDKLADYFGLELRKVKRGLRTIARGGKAAE